MNEFGKEVAKLMANPKSRHEILSEVAKDWETMNSSTKKLLCQQNIKITKG